MEFGSLTKQWGELCAPKRPYRLLTEKELNKGSYQFFQKMGERLNDLQPYCPPDQWDKLSLTFLGELNVEEYSTLMGSLTLFKKRVIKDDLQIITNKGRYLCIFTIIRQ